MSKKGVKFTEAHKKKLSESKLREKHWNWQGGKKVDNPNYMTVITTAYKKKHRANYVVYQRNRIARLRGAVGNISFGEWEKLKRQYGLACPSCKKVEPEIKLTIDHIIPLSIGGANTIENIQPLCKSCNSKKHTKIIKYELGG